MSKSGCQFNGKGYETLCFSTASNSETCEETWRQTKDNDETVKQETAKKKEKERKKIWKKSVALDMNHERHSKGALSFVLAHTQASYQDSI